MHTKAADNSIEMTGMDPRTAFIQIERSRVEKNRERALRSCELRCLLQLAEISGSATMTREGALFSVVFGSAAIFISKVTWHGKHLRLECC